MFWLCTYKIGKRNRIMSSLYLHFSSFLVYLLWNFVVTLLRPDTVNVRFSKDTVQFLDVCRGMFRIARNGRSLAFFVVMKFLQKKFRYILTWSELVCLHVLLWSPNLCPGGHVCRHKNLQSPDNCIYDILWSLCPQIILCVFEKNTPIEYVRCIAST